MYGCETWSPGNTEIRKINAFQNKCMRKILRIYWPDKLSNEELRERTRMEDIGVTIRKRILKYLGHTLRGGNEDVKTAMRWTP